MRKLEEIYYFPYRGSKAVNYYSQVKINVQIVEINQRCYILALTLMLGGKAKL